MIGKLGFTLILIFLLAMPFVNAQTPVVGTWRGYARMSDSLAASGTYVTAHVDNASSAAATTIIGGGEYASTAPSGYYSLDVQCTGSYVNFRICGITVSIPSEACTSGPHYNGTQPNFNLSVTKLSSGACSYSCACSGGKCCNGATEYTAGEGTGTCQSSACAATTSATTTTSGGGGGGGGGTTTVAATTTIAVVETGTVAKIENGTSATFNVTQSDTLKIESVNVEVKNTVNNVQITVKESSLPSGANVAIAADAGAVYKYLEITKTNVQDADINKVKIKFKVEKSWLTENNIDPATIALQRLVGSSWTKLSTSMVSEDATYYYFEAESPGLSVFAITGQKVVTTTSTVTSVATTTIPVTPPILPPTTMFIFIGILLIAAVVVFFLRKSKRSFKPPTFS